VVCLVVYGGVDEKTNQDKEFVCFNILKMFFKKLIFQSKSNDNLSHGG
jgi:hypothetical protein